MTVILLYDCLQARQNHSFLAGALLRFAHEKCTHKRHRSQLTLLSSSCNSTLQTAQVHCGGELRMCCFTYGTSTYALISPNTDSTRLSRNCSGTVSGLYVCELVEQTSLPSNNQRNIWLRLSSAQSLANPVTFAPFLRRPMTVVSLPFGRPRLFMVAGNCNPLVPGVGDTVIRTTDILQKMQLNIRTWFVTETSQLIRLYRRTFVWPEYLISAISFFTAIIISVRTAMF